MCGVPSVGDDLTNYDEERGAYVHDYRYRLGTCISIASFVSYRWVALAGMRHHICLGTGIYKRVVLDKLSSRSSKSNTLADMQVGTEAYL